MSIGARNFFAKLQDGYYKTKKFDADFETVEKCTIAETKKIYSPVAAQNLRASREKAGNRLLANP
jgi:hypothetical protein